MGSSRSYGRTVNSVHIPPTVGRPAAVTHAGCLSFRGVAVLWPAPIADPSQRNNIAADTAITAVKMSTPSPTAFSGRYSRRVEMLTAANFRAHPCLRDARGPFL